MLPLVLLLLALPVVELYVIVQVAGSIGAIETIFLLVAMSIGGAWLVKYEGLGVARRVQRQLGRGELPAAEVVDGLLILAAGVLMLAPGFISDAVGLLLLIPFVRHPVRDLCLRRFESRLRVATRTSGPTSSGFSVYSVTDVRSYERSGGDVAGSGHRPPAPELGPSPPDRRH